MSCADVLTVLERHSVSVEYVPSGIDNVSRRASHRRRWRPELYTIMAEIKKQAAARTRWTCTDHIAVVAAVGRKMAFRPGMSGRIFAALGEQRHQHPHDLRRARTSSTSSSAWTTKDFEQAIRVLYNSFVK